MSANTNTETINIPQTKIIRIKDVMAITGISKSHIYLLANEKRFPLSIPLVPGGSSRGWVESEVYEWVNQRIAERDMEV